MFRGRDELETALRHAMSALQRASADRRGRTLRRRPARWAVRTLQAAIGAVALGLVVFLVLDTLFPFPEETLERPPSTVIRDVEGRPLRIFLAPDDRYRLPVRLEDVSPDLVRALVGSEDRWFYRHPGVNPLAVLRAAWTNLRAGRVVSGASTIPMQIARMAEPKRRTLGGKVVEAFRALQLDWHHDKDRLLELYLGLTPYGGNLEGVGAAARFYFDKPASRLSLGEAALLTALPRSPSGYDPTRHPAAAAAARARVLRQLQERGTFPARTVEDALEQALPAALTPAPFRAPHFTRYVHGRVPAGTPEVATTLDLRLQTLAEERVAAHVGRLREQGIRNAAVVILETRGRPLRAMVGSADFFDADADGQVNNAVALRSPGSTLKPFVYALGIDAGVVVPDSWLLDIPTDFSGYIAQNYDGEYRGRVLARDALRLSLNASAVRLLAQVGLERFHHLLVKAGTLDDERPAIDYGLPLILGAGEVRLLDLANLYATLAEGGAHRPVRMLAGPEGPAEPPAGGPAAAPATTGAPRAAADWQQVPGEPDTPPAAAGGQRSPGEPGTRLLSAEAAALVTEILTSVERPDMPGTWELTREVPSVAWKTGTSFGHRDAWALGFSGRYAIGVWVGNPDGRGQEGISGARHAGPLLFDLFRALEPGGSPGQPGWRAPRLTQTRVCSVSHHLPGPFCPTTTSITTVPGRTRLPTCEVHRRVFVDAVDGDLLAGDCLAQRAHRPQVLTVFPAELVAWWRARGRSGIELVPPLSRHCRQVPGTDAPRIVSPDASTPYLLRGDAPLEHQRIPLLARAAGGASRLYWYEDGSLVASGAPGERLFLTPRPGAHRLVVVDSAGRADAITFRVR